MLLVVAVAGKVTCLILVLHSQQPRMIADAVGKNLS